MTREELFDKNPMIKIRDKYYSCPTSVTMALIGGKWKGVILSHLIAGKKRYGELRNSMPTITERTLSMQLKKMIADDLVKKKVYGSKPPMKVEYSLTEFGKSVTPLLQSIIEWGIFAGTEKGEFVELEDYQHSNGVGLRSS